MENKPSQLNKTKVLMLTVILIILLIDSFFIIYAIDEMRAYIYQYMYVVQDRCNTEIV